MAFYIASWQQAENHCQSLNGHLVSFTKEKDLTDLVLHVPNDATYYWTGLRYVDNVWSFSDNADTQYANSYLALLTRPNKEICYLIKNIGRFRPGLKTQRCTAHNNFICQFRGNGFTTSMFSCSSKYKFLFILFNSILKIIIICMKTDIKIVAMIHYRRKNIIGFNWKLAAGVLIIFDIV